MAKDRRIDMVILGFLMHESLTGYDIKKRIDNEISFFWKGSYGSIYPSLNMLEKNGFIKRISIEDNNYKRKKFQYEITDSGKQILEKWLVNSKAINDLKYETLLKVFFGGTVNQKITIETIIKFENEIKINLKILKTYKENLSKTLENKDHVYYYLTVLFGVNTYEGYLKWCEESLDYLKKDF